MTLSSFSVASSVSILAVTLGFCPIVSSWVVHSKRVLGPYRIPESSLLPMEVTRDGDSTAGMVLA